MRLSRLARNFCRYQSSAELQYKLASELSKSSLAAERWDEKRKAVDNAFEKYNDNKNGHTFVVLVNNLVEAKMYDEAARMHKLWSDEYRKDPYYDSIIGRIKPGWINSKNLINKQRSFSRFIWMVIRYMMYYQIFLFIDSRKNEKGESNQPIMNLFNINSEEPAQSSNTRFSDVRGINEFRQELEDIVDLLKNGKNYQEAGAYIQKGVLLVGPPGTGKTLLAKAFAGEAGCHFYYKSASEFEEMYVGLGANRVKNLFATAKKTAPSIIFIDEIEQLTPDRTSSAMRGDSQTINQLLTEMDGFNKLENVIVIGATNLPEKIDKAVLRPGRFDKIINIPYPDREGRKEIFEYYLEKVKFNKTDVNIDTLVKATIGFSGAAIKNMVNIAVLNAIKEKRSEANHEDFEFSLDRVTMGIGRKKLFVSDKEKYMTAYHEGGHALVNLITKSSTPLHKVTILPRGGALGFTSMLPDQDTYYMNKAEVINQIQVALGGRVAEELIYGNDDVTTGCSSDMEKATEFAFKLLREYGMNRGHLIARNKDDLSDGYNAQIDQKAQYILRENLEAVRSLLKKNRNMLEKIADALVKQETMSKNDIEVLLNVKF